MASENPIILGRRNCARCTRWKLAIDFGWKWPMKKLGRGMKRRSKTPVIDNNCTVCRREIERERYQSLSPEDRHAKIAAAVASNRARRERQNQQYRRAQLATYRANTIVATANGHNYNNTEIHEVDIIPFRMWMLGMIRQTDGGVAGIARQLDLDEAQVRRIANGYYWDDDRFTCQPTPVLRVRITTVDEWGILLGHPGLFGELYPWED